MLLHPTHRRSPEPTECFVSAGMQTSTEQETEEGHGRRAEEGAGLAHTVALMLTVTL